MGYPYLITENIIVHQFYYTGEEKKNILEKTEYSEAYYTEIILPLKYSSYLSVFAHINWLL